MTPSKQEPIAIIGSGCRFPGGSSTPSKLWDLLSQPRDVLTRIPNERYNPTAFYHPNGQRPGYTNVQHAYTLTEDYREFDPSFFSLKPVEADSMDPQQRVLLETVYEALESAGQTIESLQGSNTAMYCGLMCMDYHDTGIRDLDSLPTYFATGASRCIISNRVSYFFNWHGPSMTIDTACSSSLVAMHQAVQVLRSGESRVAVAAGANLILGPEVFISESNLKMLSPDGRSRMWDSKANGYARGDGVAAVVLKTLSAAIADGDHIECIVRETGVNQDGRTKGITMPSSEAQMQLIRDTYARAGLDLQRSSDRPQYFEAHGTGTPAGDPVEARAIRDAFFDEEKLATDLKDEFLYVGSIKTVIGHTEGTAGLAGVLKASLALKHGVIPPNMLLSNLSSSVKPFYSNLRITTSPKDWPELQGGPRRASVNSFGFGGTNAHAILEAYDNPIPALPKSASLPVYSPLVFSAASEESLVGMLKAYANYLRENPNINLRYLAYTLQARRTTLPVKAHVAASSVDDVVAQLDDLLKDSASTQVGVRPAPSPPAESGILGVFTGQGAQWATMGRELIRGSEFARARLSELEESLRGLPEEVAPTWSIIEELTRDAAGSRMGEAILSQPLCTAIQVVVVDLLRSAGIRFKSVVGHSSGEIAAAYAAGFISAKDAIRIAYYRGVTAKLASGENGSKGAMMAVGTSEEDAAGLCELPMFEGRIAVAAVNSSSSVTISGDADAIAEAQKVFAEEKKFARALKVDTAYHSHHMKKCSPKYMELMHECGIKPLKPESSETTWYSSVHGGDAMACTEDLKGAYWRNNMLMAVRFYQALSAAVKNGGPHHLVVEVGPHAALKGPASQTVQEITGDQPFYVGTLSRNKNDVESISDSLGKVWGQFGQGSVDWSGYEALLSGGAPVTLLKDLPSYSWTHDRIYWYEGRSSREFRTREEPVHELLGARSPDGTNDHIRWHNLLRMEDLPWLAGHDLQGQAVFPAAAYIAMAIDASLMAVQDPDVQLVKVQDITIGRPITFDNPSATREVRFNLDVIESTSTTTIFTFSCHSNSSRETSAMSLNSAGRVHVIHGTAAAAALPLPEQDDDNLVPVDGERFYASLRKLGYGYNGAFEGLLDLKRRLGKATGLVDASTEDNRHSTTLSIHPAVLDLAFQAAFLAYSAPGDGRLWSLHVPTYIRGIAVDPRGLFTDDEPLTKLRFTASTGDPLASTIDGDIDMYEEGGKSSLIQIQGLRAVPFAAANPNDDCKMFADLTWDLGVPDGSFIEATTFGNEDRDISSAAERVAAFYLKQLRSSVAEDVQNSLGGHAARLFAFADLPGANSSWTNDTQKQIESLVAKYPHSIDLQVVTAVGKALPGIVQGSTSAEEQIAEASLLGRFSSETLGLSAIADALAQMIKQLCHRYSRLKILEIGASSGVVAQKVLNQLGDTFDTYTFTNRTSDHFEAAKASFKAHIDKMVFKKLDLEGDPAEQEFTANSYDLVISTLAVGQSESPETFLSKARELLKPGGYILLLEATKQSIRTALTLGTPIQVLSPGAWDSLLQRSGFTGIEATTPELDQIVAPFSAMLAQAVTPEIEMYRQPLAATEVPSPIEKLVIVGGSTAPIKRVVLGAKATLAGFAKTIDVFEKLEDVDIMGDTSDTTVLLLSDLDEPIFKSAHADGIDGFKQLIFSSRDIVWVFKGARYEDPYANMSPGMGRTIAMESPHLRLHLVDLDFNAKPDALQISEILLRWHIAGTWEKQSTNENFLLSIEPELSFEGGRIFVPRVYPNKERNDRYNSARRRITAKANPKTQQIQITHGGDTGYGLEVQPFFHRPVQNTSNTVSLHVTLSSLSAVRLTTGTSYYVVAGQTTDRKHFIGFSNSSASLLRLPKSFVIELNGPIDERLFSIVTAYLTAETILGLVPSNGRAIVHDAEAILATALDDLACGNTVRVLFTSTKQSPGYDAAYVDPNSSLQAIKNILPRESVTIVDLSKDQEGHEAAELLRRAAPTGSLQESSATLFFQQATAAADIDSGVMSLLQSAIVVARNNKSTGVPAQKLSLEDVSSVDSPKPVSAIIDWTSQPEISAAIAPIDDRSLFAGDKTYVLFGLTGGLGLSLCDWMVHRGARNLVVTSRNPKVDKKWLEKLASFGANIKIMANDITSRESVRALSKTIGETMPPVGGVANGAMVLRDSTLYEMDAEGLKAVLKPKVDGTVYLDEVYQDASLDFFILFSSITCVFGNSGQSSYTAANMFMTSLAANRRKRGLVASVMDIGAMLGTGYMDRELSQSRRDELLGMGYLGMSERDFHQTFAEAIVAGIPENGQHPEIVAGLRCITSDDAALTRWFESPKYQHCITWTGASAGGDSGARANVSVRKRLQEASSPNETREIVTDAFATRLQTVLQLRSDNVNNRDLMLKTGLDELGVDSLIAVDVRSWFLKELEVDIPVLQILSGVTVQSLIDTACDKLPAELTAQAATNEELASPDATGPETPPADAPAASTDGAAAIAQTGSSSPSLRASDVSNDGAEEQLTPPSLSSGPDEEEEIKEEVSEEPPRPAILREAPLSLNQSRFWFLRSYLDDETTFNITCRIRVEGALRIKSLEKAVAALGQRHEALRTCFFVGDNGQPSQGVLEKSLLRLEKMQIDSEEASVLEHEKLTKHVYDLGQGEVMRILLLTQTADLHYLLVGYHHINMDGVSFQVLFSDLEKFYTFQKLPQQFLQHPDYAYRQRRAMETNAYSKDLEYWREEFITFPDPLPLFPFSKFKTRPKLEAYGSSRYDIRLEPALAARIKEVSRTASKASTFHFHMTVLRVLLARYLSIEDISIGIADANRLDSDTMAAIGMYLNLLPLRFKNNAHDVTFAEAMSESRAKAFAALTHSKVPFDVILDKVAAPRSASHSPLFQAFVDFRQGQEEARPFGNVHMKGDMFEMGETAYDINVDIIENQNGDTLITLALQKELYSEDAAKTVSESYLYLVEQFCDNPELKFGDASLFTQADIAKAINLGRGLASEPEWPATVSHRVDEMIAQYANRPALKDGSGNNYTYAQMADRIHAIALALKASHVKLSDRVALYQQPTAEWVCSMLAIFRVGATYVPLDMRTPVEQHRAILNNSQPVVILCHNETAHDAPQLGFDEIKRINTDSLQCSTDRVTNEAAAHLTAIILHTSGTTGVPKGICLSHSNICNILEFSTKMHGAEPQAVLQQTAFTFDLCLDQVFTALGNGGRLYVVPRTRRGDAVAISELIFNEQITYTLATTSEYQAWLRFGDQDLLRAAPWKVAVTAGELVTNGFKRAIQGLGKPSLRLYNGYGPGEASILSHKTELFYQSEDDYVGPDSTPVPVGQSLPNYATYIMDERLRILPVGIPGEMVIGGAGISKGYINQEALTAEKFINDTHASPKAVERGWTKIHRTGDLASLCANGTFVVLGRIDGNTQVKVRGIRMDVRDIESAILQAAKGCLVEAVVSMKAEKQLLVAHVVFAPGYPSENQVRFLKDLESDLPLPPYMIPSAIMPLQSLPLTSHGKIDRRAVSALPLDIPEPVGGENTQELTDVESWVRDLWLEVLPEELAKRAMIDVDTSFFAAGGNSLTLVNLQNLVRSRFGVVFRLNDLFEANRLGRMASLIEKTATSSNIDWDQEIRIPPSLKQSVKLPRPAKATNGKRTVLLTGSTGFLGGKMLKELVSDSNVGTIHCVAVRNSADRNLATKSDKIQMHAGDLSQSYLGLSEEVFYQLAVEVDVIIHNGAQRSFWEYYQMVRKPNVQSTHELVRLALVGNTPLHFLSSGGVELYTTQEASRPPADGSDGYVASKWASEQVLRGAARHLGLPVYIHRPTSAAPSSSIDAPEILDKFVQAANKLHTLPVNSGWRGTFDVVNVNSLAETIARSALESTTPGGFTKAAQIFNYSGSHRVDVETVISHVCDNADSADDWTKTAAIYWIGETKKQGEFPFIITAQDLTLAERMSEEGDSLILRR